MDPLLHSAVHDVISRELNLPPMSSFMSGGVTELLKLDLEPWKVDNTSVARLPPVPTAGASVSRGLNLCRQFDSVVIFAARC